MSRAFLDQGYYNILVPKLSRTTLDVGGAGAQEEFKIIENVYPPSDPAIAENNGKAAIAYVYLDPDDAVHQETEIYVVFYAGSTGRNSLPQAG